MRIHHAVLMLAAAAASLFAEGAPGRSRPHPIDAVRVDPSARDTRDPRRDATAPLAADAGRPNRAFSDFMWSARDREGEGVPFRSGLFVPAKHATAETRSILDAPIAATSTTVLTFLHDEELKREIKAEAVSGSSPSSRPHTYAELPGDLAAMTKLMHSLAGHLVVLVAHSEGSAIVRLAQGKLDRRSIPIAAVEAAASAAGVHLLLFTCSGAEKAANPAPAETVWPWEIVPAIRSSRPATTYGDFLAAFGSERNPIIVKGVRRLENGNTALDVERLNDDFMFDGVLVVPTPAILPPQPAVQDRPHHDIFDIIFGVLLWLGGAFLGLVAIGAALAGGAAGIEAGFRRALGRNGGKRR